MKVLISLFLFVAGAVQAQPVITGIMLKDKHPVATAYITFTTPTLGDIYEIQYRPLTQTNWLYMPGSIEVTNTTATIVVVVYADGLFRVVQVHPNPRP